MDIDPDLAQRLLEAQGMRLDPDQVRAVSDAVAALGPAQRIGHVLPFEAESFAFPAVLNR